MGGRVIKQKLIDNTKLGILGVEPVGYKASLVTKGFTQIEGVDYTKKLTTIQMLLTLVVQLDIELEQLDNELEQLAIETTFLHGDLEVEITMGQLKGTMWMEILKRYAFQGNHRMVWSNHHIKNILIASWSLMVLKETSCLYMKKIDKIVFIYFVGYLVACKDKVEIENFKSNSLNFKMKALGTIKWILGMVIQRNKKLDTLTVTQKDYA